ncbi:uncharacterized protein K452DRAFT_331973 [Aplosporella prunicola CBS 121167]|uniref:Ecp2 effector protein domain-containing protein n=1 Tax=Aplosporella prunicola CBS 121167 TaxID=1176127 RepID=A0A6A6BDZ2_9PEZI|nr:uncharacterized protein K452DRAFT_331973 [Aplosporella prunicola CBS 121167]KAF2142296.1 hypothetical protein K452DRAFT_331973 [Aplosporella prunicola CBS 121167]
MHVNTKLLATALFTASLPLGILAEKPHCETSTGSPDTRDITDAINEMHGWTSDVCENGNGVKSKCTTLVSHKSAAISLCGDAASLSCKGIASVANDIQQACLSDGKAGGWVSGSYTAADGSTPDYWVEVIHS